MKLNILHISLFVLMLGGSIYSQTYTHYTTKEGLPSNHVYRITQDIDGFIWFITDKGMVKYNGTNFKTFTTKGGLPTNDIWDIRITKDKKVWYFSKAAKLGYILKDSVFSYKSKIEDEILQPLSINQHKGTVSFSNSKKYFKLINSSWHSQSILNKSTATEIITHSLISKFEITDDSLFVFDHSKNKIKSIVRPIQLKKVHLRSQINDSLYVWINDVSYTIFNLNTQKLYLRSLSRQLKGTKTGLVRINTANHQIQFSGQNFVGLLDENYNLSRLVIHQEEINSHFSFIDKHQNLWIATFNKGVFFIPKSKRHVVNLLSVNKVGRLNMINNDLIANVYNSGFYNYDPQNKRFSPFIKERGFMYSSNYIDSLETTFFCTNHKMIRYKNNELTSFSFKNQLNSKARQLVYYNSFLYGNNSQELNKIDPKNLMIIESKVQGGIRDLLVYKNKLLLATSNGLKKLEKDSISFVFDNDIHLKKPALFIKKINNNQLLLGTDGFGAYITDLKNVYLLKETDFLSVQDAYISNNTIWLATNEGAWLYKRNNNKYDLIQKITVNMGLESNLINSIYLIDKKLIVSGNEGIYSLPLDQSFKKTFPKIYIDKIEYGNKILSSNDQFAYLSGTNTNVSVASIDFSENKNLSYQYKIAPIQENWIETNSTLISFNDLPPSSYTLVIKNTNNTQNFSFTITPLWWQTYVFKVGSRVLFLILLGFVFFRIRKRELDKKITKINIQKQMAEHELHALRSHMNPHFVFNSLNAIQYYLNDNKIELSEKYLVKFSKLIRMFFDFSQQKEISLNEEHKLLKAYLEIEKLRFGKDFNYSFYIDQKLNHSLKIPSMLLQPIVENAVNHGLFHKRGKGKIEIFFNSLSDLSFQVIIQDDGIGRKKAAKIKEESINDHQSKSMELFKNRLQLINQSKLWLINYMISDLNALDKTGTKVVLVFKQTN